MHPDLKQRLRDLPSEIQPPFGWEEFQRRTRLRAQRERLPVFRRYAVAACVAVLALAVGAVWSLLTDRADPPVATATGPVRSVPAAAERPDARATGPVRSVPAADPMHRAPTPAAVVAGLEHVAADQWLARLPPEPTVVRVGTHLAVTDLEDRIAWVDDLLTRQRLENAAGAQVALLQRERARLVDSLARLRYVEAVSAQLP